MTYPRVLLFFVIPAILVATVAAYRLQKLDRRFFVALSAMLGIVYVTTTPWDNLAVKWGIWFFDWDKTLGIRWAYLPLEEYAFFGLETVLAALVFRILDGGART